MDAYMCVILVCMFACILKFVSICPSVNLSIWASIHSCHVKWVFLELSSCAKSAPHLIAIVSDLLILIEF